MHPTIGAAIASGAVAVALVFNPSPAGATSINRIMDNNTSIVSDLEEMSSAANDTDLTSLANACVDLGDHAETALAFSRPRSLPRIVWTHMRNAWHAYSEAADLCDTGARTIDADLIDQSTHLLDTATDETSTATHLLKASRG